MRCIGHSQAQKARIPAAEPRCRGSAMAVQRFGRVLLGQETRGGMESEQGCVRASSWEWKCVKDAHSCK